MLPYAHRDEDATRSRGRRIMVIDDSLVVRTILKIGLERKGFQVECCEDGVEALLSLGEPGRQALPDLIILDIMLPRLDGYEVMRLLKGRPDLCGIVVLILSARDGTLDRLKGRLAGAKGYVTKPFKMQEVVGAVRDLLGTAQDAVGSR
jgi:twitching motility two-component system response regulator PilG